METSLPCIGKGGRLFSGNKLGCLRFPIALLPLVSLISKLFELLCRLETKPEVYLIMRHYVISQLIAEDRDTGRLRPIAGLVDRDDGEDVIASLGGI